MRQNKTRLRGFALYEVLIGVTIFVIGILALGRALENCLNASSLTSEENVVRQILSNRMAEIQANPSKPDAARDMKLDSDYGTVRLLQKSVPAGLKQEEGLELGGVNRVTLTAEWSRDGVKQSKQLMFYVYRAG